MTISNRRLYKCFRLQILIESGSKLFPSPDLTTHNSSDRSEWCNKCMHQYLGFPQIRPTAAACNYKHPQSPDQRRLPALPKSPDNPQPKSFVSPAPRHKTSYIILRLRSKTYTMYRLQVQSPRLCRPQAFTARLRSTESQLHKPQLPQRKWPFSSFLLSPFQFFSESTGWEEQRSRTLLLSVCQHGEKSHYLSFNDSHG